ncbi:MAG: response regulator [Alkalispirochaeta sp.]
MAYRFLIIDDEPVVREGIATTIDWAAHGFELVGACRDGREGMQAVDELRPDVVLTDICMPFVDGLELAAAIGEQYPAIKTLLLTGHDEFEYAQAAIKLKVQDFLLKPITADELRVVLDSLRRELDAERDYRQKLDRLNEQVRASLPVYRERFLNHLVRDTISEAEQMRSFGLLDLDLPGPACIALVVDPDTTDTTDSDDIDADDRLLDLAVHDLVTETVAKIDGAVSFSTPEEEAVVLLSVPEEGVPVASALAVAEEISDRVERELGRTVTIGVGDGQSGLAAPVHTFREARMALDYRFVLGPGQIITIQQARGEPSGVTGPLESEPRDRFLHAVKTGSEADVIEALERVVDAVRTESDDIHRCVVFMHRFLAETISAVETVGVDYREVPSLGVNPFDHLSKMKTLDEMERWFREFITETLQILDTRRLDHSHRKALAARDYINTHFADPDLSLGQVCTALAVSKSHLSPIFKAHTGMTFVEYVTERRMEEAKLLLRSDAFKVYEIAEQVGFRDAHYFSLTFKKQTGYTPREFQDTILRKVP